MKKRICIFLLGLCFSFCLFLACPLSIQAQTISTFAGNNVFGFLGDGSAATGAEFARPTGVVVDAAGNVFITDEQNHRVRKVNTAGIISTIAGNGTSGFFGDGGQATDAELSIPIDVALDAAGNLYISDETNSRIRKVDAVTGIITTYAGSASAGFGGDGGAATNASLADPWGIFIDPAGNLYIADETNERVRMVNTAGFISTIAGNGILGYMGDGASATSAELSHPSDINMDAAGNIYIAEYENQVIRKIDGTGTISTFAGTGAVSGSTGDGGPATAAKLFGPIGIAFDCIGNMYIGDGNNNKIRKISTTGTITTFAGTGTGGYLGDGGPATAAELGYPYTVAFDAFGNLYTAESNNNVIRKITNIDHAPFFTRGHTNSITVCENATALSIDSLLAVDDIDTGQYETWSIISAPAHGTLVAAYTATATGDTLFPAGLSYTPATGYSGSDVFIVQVRDCNNLYDTTTINVTVNPLPNTGTISGIDSVCPGHAVTLSESAAGGTWGTTNSIISSVASSGVVTGGIPGIDSITYTVTALGCTATGDFYFLVRTIASCNVGITQLQADPAAAIKVYPNPNLGTFTVDLASDINEPVNFIITNIVGEKVKEFASATTNNPVTVELDGPSGIYFINAVTAYGNWSAKIVLDNIGR